MCKPSDQKSENYILEILVYTLVKGILKWGSFCNSHSETGKMYKTQNNKTITVGLSTTKGSPLLYILDRDYFYSYLL